MDLQQQEVRNCPPELARHRMVCLDIETTGLDKTFNNIIELGTVEVVNGRNVREYSRVFGGGRSPMYLVRQVHGIRDIDRIGRPTFRMQAHKVAAYLSNAVLVTHNGTKFDIPFLEAKLEEAGETLSYKHHVDTYLLSRKLGHEANSLGELSRRYGIPYGEWNHRGVADCLCTLQLLYAMVEENGADALGLYFT